jgi:hypothetical protein
MPLARRRREGAGAAPLAGMLSLSYQLTSIIAAAGKS